MTLPSRPDMTRLRHMARMLLRNWRANQPEALARVASLAVDPASSERLLSHAQFVIAREHGFASWARLKAEVEARTAQRTARRSKAALVAARAAARSALIDDRVHELEALVASGDAAALALHRPMGRGEGLLVRDRITRDSTLWTRVVDLLILGLQHDNPRVRYECAHMLDTYDDGRAVGALSRLLHDPVPRVRRMAAIHALVCDACKSTPAPWNAEICRRIAELAIDDSSVQVRRHAVWTLPRCGPQQAQDVYAEILARETDGVVRKSAQQALDRIHRCTQAR